MNPLAAQQKEFLPVHWSRVMVDENDTKMTKILTQRRANFWKLETKIIIVFFNRNIDRCFVKLQMRVNFPKTLRLKKGRNNLLQELSKTLNYAKNALILSLVNSQHRCRKIFFNGLHFHQIPKRLQFFGAHGSRECRLRKKALRIQIFERNKEKIQQSKSLLFIRLAKLHLNDNQGIIRNKSILSNSC